MAHLEYVTSETRKALGKIAPIRSMPENESRNAPLSSQFWSRKRAFNERMIIAIMYLDRDPVLHIVDESTYFRVSKFLLDISVRMIRKTILGSWANIYIVLPQPILVDQGHSLDEEFTDLSRIGGTKVKRTDIEAPSSLNLVERYHQPLHTVYRKLRMERFATDKQLTLALTIKVMNDTLDLNGGVSSTLVLGEHLSMFTRSGTPKKLWNWTNAQKLRLKHVKRCRTIWIRSRLAWHWDMPYQQQQILRMNAMMKYSSGVRSKSATALASCSNRTFSKTRTQARSVCLFAIYLSTHVDRSA